MLLHILLRKIEIFETRFVNTEAFRAIKESLNHYCSLNSEHCGGNRRRGSCWLYNPDNNPTIEDFYASFGAFSFYFGEDEDYEYEWRAQDFLYQESSGSRWFCLGLEVFE